MNPRNLFRSIVAFVIMITASCAGEKETTVIPDGILAPEKMRVVLTDFALAESAAVLNIRNVPLNHVDSVYAFDPLSENGVRKTQFDSSVKFYAENPSLYKQIYDSVLVTLSQMKGMRSATVQAPGSK